MIDVELTEQEFRFADSLQDKDTEITISMSKDFCSLFGIEKKYDEVFDEANQRRYFSFTVTNIPKPVEDTSQLFYGPFAVRNNCDIAVHDEVIFKLTPQYWTINMFKRAIIALGKSLPKDSRLSSMTNEEGSSPEKCTLVLTPTSNRKRQISYLPLMTIDFRLIFRPSFYIEKADYDQPYKIPLSIRSDLGDVPWKVFTSSLQVKHNFYPTVTSLVNGINEVMKDLNIDLSNQREGSYEPFTFFEVNDDIVTYNAKKGYSVLLSAGLFKLLHLPNDWLIENISGSKAVVMKTHSRTHFYIHLDCLVHHYINNNVSNLIRTIPNNAPIDEKVQLTFNDHRYYAVAKRYLSTINMYITDDYFDGILPFIRDVAYTLHFRKCHPFS